MTDIDHIQELVRDEARKRWPHLTVTTEGLAMAEEGLEMVEVMVSRLHGVVRAILKRGEGTRDTPAEWTDRLRIELGQTVCVALNIMAMEGWRASEVMSDTITDWFARPLTQRRPDEPIPVLPPVRAETVVAHRDMHHDGPGDFGSGRVRVEDHDSIHRRYDPHLGHVHSERVPTAPPDVPMAWVHCTPLFVRAFSGCGNRVRRPCECTDLNRTGHDHRVAVPDAIAMYERAILENLAMR